MTLLIISGSKDVSGIALLLISERNDSRGVEIASCDFG